MPGFMDFFGFGSRRSPSWTYEPPWPRDQLSPQTSAPPLVTVPASPKLVSEEQAYSHFPTIPNTIDEETDVSRVKEYEAIDAMERRSDGDDLAHRFVAFQDTVREKTFGTNLKKVFHQLCPTGPHATEFVQRSLEHLVENGWSLNQMFPILSDGSIPLEEPRDIVLELRSFISSPSAYTADSLNELKRRYRTLLAHIVAMSARGKLENDIALEIVWELGAVPAAIDLSELERASFHRALWASFAMMPSKSALSTFDQEFFRQVIRSFRMQTLEDLDATNALAIFVDMVARADQNKSVVSQECLWVWKSIPTSRLTKLVEAATLSIVQSKDRSNHSLSDWLNKLLIMIRDDKRLTQSLLPATYNHLAANHVTLGGIADHLKSLDPKKAIRVILKHWVVQCLPNTMTVYEDLPSAQRPMFKSFEDAYISSLAKYREPTLHGLLHDLLRAMDNHRIRNARIVESFCELIYHRRDCGGRKALLRFLRRLKPRTIGADRYGQPLNPAFFYRLILEHKEKDPVFAYRLCDIVIEMDLELDPRFPLEVIRKSLIRWKQMARILKTAKYLEQLPVIYHAKASDTLLDLRNELIHQIAYQYALDEGRTVRAAARSVYRLYKYLYREKLEIGPLFTKAAVIVFVTRPFQENRFVSMRRYRYVRRVVEMVEGPEVARKIDRMFWQWRGELIKFAKDRLTANGGQGEAHVNTMKRLGLLEPLRRPGLPALPKTKGDAPLRIGANP